MKRFLILFVAATFLGFMSGCDLDDDGYSLDDAWVGFGLVKKEASASTFTVVMDDGEILFPTANSDLVNEVVNNERVLVNFTILGNKDNPDHNEYYYVKINSLKKILYKGIFTITPAKEDSIGNDPVRVADKWIKKDKLFSSLPDNDVRRIRTEQAIIVDLEPQQALETLPNLLSGKQDRERVLELLEIFSSEANLTEQQERILQMVHTVLDGRAG